MSSYCTTKIVLLAGSIYSGINSPSAQSVGYVSGWITSSGALGDINNRLNTQFYLSGDGPCIAGGFGDNEGAILDLIYRSDYYRGRAAAVLAGADSTSWVMISEGDSKVQRETSFSRSRGYLELSKEIQRDLHIAINNWKRGNTPIASVDGSSSYSWPTP